MMFLTNNHNWPSEYTRGYQIAEALGCRVNQPAENYDETIICVKCFFEEKLKDEMSKFTNIYMDMIDSEQTIQVAKMHPTFGIIAITSIMKEYLESNIDNKVVMIPEHTCNFEQQTRPKEREVKTVGYVGSPKCFDLRPDEVKNALKQIGLDFKILVCETTDGERTRKEVCDFYKSIDIQLCFRTEDNKSRPAIYRNPLKVFNAGSFGVPTVAYPELSYRWCAGTYFLEALDLAGIIDKCYMLKNDMSLYKFYAYRVYEWSRQFDILNVAKEYAKLAPNETFFIDDNVRKMRNGKREAIRG